ncbi:MAG: hypothetical protein KAU90_07400, partial [Sulfurovaceae bacterium]|nr:hypothetical protein [Sulfurovaceae bacterium]
YNKVKTPAIVTLILGLANLILAIVLVKWTTLGLYGIVLASAIVLSIRNAIFTPIYASFILKIPVVSFIKYYILSIVFYISSYITTTIFATFYHVDSYMILLWVMTLSVVFSLILFYIYMRFDKQLYQIFNKLLKSKIKEK